MCHSSLGVRHTLTIDSYKGRALEHRRSPITRSGEDSADLLRRLDPLIAGPAFWLNVVGKDDMLNAFARETAISPKTRCSMLTEPESSLPQRQMSSGSDKEEPRAGRVARHASWVLIILTVVAWTVPTVLPEHISEDAASHSFTIGAASAIIAAFIETIRMTGEFSRETQNSVDELRTSVNELMEQQSHERNVRAEVSRLADQIIRIGSNSNTATLGAIVTTEMRKAHDMVDELANRQRFAVQFEPLGDQFLNKWLTPLSQMIANKGEYLTISNAVAWSPRHLGFVNLGAKDERSVFLQRQLSESARYGYAVRRIMVVPPVEEIATDQRAQAYFRATLTAYQQACEGMLKKNQRHETLAYVCTTLAEYEQHFRASPEEIQASENIALWITGDFQLANTVRYRATTHPPDDGGRYTSYEIDRVTFSVNADYIRSRKRLFDDMWASGMCVQLSELVESLAE